MASLEEVPLEEDHDTFLNDIWTVYFHDPNNQDWTHSSYVNMGNISTIDDFWQHFDSAKENIHKGMFFVMREHIFPAWDDPCNIHGGCLSIKVLKDEMYRFWEDLGMRLVGEDLLIDSKKEMWDQVNGISASPKKHFCIIKIWLKSDDLNNKSFFNLLQGYYGDVIYKSNLENINNDSNKV